MYTGLKIFNLKPLHNLWTPKIHLLNTLIFNNVTPVMLFNLFVLTPSLPPEQF